MPRPDACCVRVHKHNARVLSQPPPNHHPRRFALYRRKKIHYYLLGERREGSSGCGVLQLQSRIQWPCMFAPVEARNPPPCLVLHHAAQTSATLPTA